MAGEDILIVDDNPTNLRLAELSLMGHGFQIRKANDAQEALAAVRERVPDLILLDLQMPGMDGFELAGRLKADAATQGIVIVALTAYAMKGDEEKARAAGCDGYVSKPIDTRRLADTVAGYLAKRSAGPSA